jgi:hypothetical protein
MRSSPLAVRGPSVLGLLLLSATLAGCGQTGFLYLQMPPTKYPPLEPGVPAPSALSIAPAYCVNLVPGEEDEAPTAAPSPGTSVEQVPYAADVIPPEPAPSSLTDILPVCATAPVTKKNQPP